MRKDPLQRWVGPAGYAKRTDFGSGLAMFPVLALMTCAAVIASAMVSLSYLYGTIETMHDAERQAFYLADSAALVTLRTIQSGSIPPSQAVWDVPIGTVVCTATLSTNWSIASVATVDSAIDRVNATYDPVHHIVISWTDNAAY